MISDKLANKQPGECGEPSSKLNSDQAKDDKGVILSDDGARGATDDFINAVARHRN